MPKRPPRCFMHHPYGPPQPTDRLRIAVVNDEGLIVSAVWSVFPHSNPHKSDVYVTATGLRSASKFSFHSDVLNHSFLSEAYQKLVEEGVVPPGSRHQQTLNIPGLPWHGLTVRFQENLLRKRGHSPDDYNGTIVALPPPRSGHVLQVGFILANGPAIQVKGAQFSIGEVGSGGRSLIAVGKYLEQDIEATKQQYNAMLAAMPVPDHVRDRIDPEDELGMHFFGIEEGAMIVTEAHNGRLIHPID
jgi:hypothetical protein